MEKLTCKECGYENEAERVYCHNCGVKLDRTLLPKTESPELKRKKESEQLKKRKQRPRAPVLKPLINSVVLALLAAVVVLVAKRPETAPADEREVAGDVPSIQFDLEDAIARPQKSPIVYSQDQVNGYLGRTIRSKSKGKVAEYVRYVRTFAQFDEGKCYIGTEYRIYKYSLFAGSWHAVEVANGKLTTSNLGGNLGRLQVPAPVMQHLDIIFKQVWDALGKEQELVSKMQSIRFGKDRVMLVPAG